MRATIKDIAADTGLSVTTVSLVLNGKAYKIPDDTKKRIMEAAKRLNYRPNQLAVSLVKKRSKTIGLIIPDIGNVFYAHMVKGIEECCRESGRTLILCNTNDRHERDMEYIHLLADQGVDGIIYVMSRESDETAGKQSVELLGQLQMPFVLLDRFLTDADCGEIILDHELGGYLAGRHLAELGHKRIACVTGPARLADSGRRLKGYVRALEEFQIPFDETLIYEGDYTMECGTRAVDALMPHGFTAVFACNDLSAFGVCRQLSKYNLKVPEDVSVVGYDDVLYAEMMAVPLTTVRQPVYEMGVESVKRLISQIKGKKSENKITVFEPKLMIRSSTVGMGQECRI
ncbi:LacI family DNA-binding transcriptional regulator [Lacrimispora saccharolytica]|uniref:Transcriptional regulator, LacI family n=1 Tax=Lacrimispora saccharolytica (strain ATCC 35040 / DSM 2544 / NRCC 2533 / WM1) TaxID=610130 RepID=D9R8S2_LACSW|nr:LacI family DNA-binding transcriptional regulator [Lacrimispora saccharolytica]ADL05801.1 transcriptional regulator, LacI family [[Clostridium] saccharolyticum WM1]QRV20061.1 LacI family DNA-binding transcriptional regulator [Lacrimispora saccharolytica]